MRAPHPHLTAAAAVLATLVAVAGPAAPAASAHGGGNPHFLTVVRQIAPTGKGIELQVLNRDDRLLLINRSGKDIVIEGYDQEPYARVLADGTVQVNTNSPADYLNDDRYAAVKVPPFAKAGAPPRWKEVDKTGRFEWHDHRIHWMAKTTPPMVHDKRVKTKIFDWSVPITQAGRQGRIAGTLYWTPLPGGQAPVGLIFGVSAILIVLCIVAIVVRRRRDGAVASAGRGEAW